MYITTTELEVAFKEGNVKVACEGLITNSVHELDIFRSESNGYNLVLIALQSLSGLTCDRRQLPDSWTRLQIHLLLTRIRPESGWAFRGDDIKAQAIAVAGNNEYLQRIINMALRGSHYDVTEETRYSMKHLTDDEAPCLFPYDRYPYEYELYDDQWWTCDSVKMIFQANLERVDECCSRSQRNWVYAANAPTMGIGLFAACPIPPNTLVTPISGLFLRGYDAISAHICRPNTTTRYILMVQSSGPDGELCIDTEKSRDLGGRINHACGATEHCEANAVIVSVPDGCDDKYWINTTREVAAGDELFVDYYHMCNEDPQGPGTMADIQKKLYYEFMAGYECPVCAKDV